MSVSTPKPINRGAYASPFSGIGVEFLPLGVSSDRSGLVLHEAGFKPRLRRWNFPNVLSPFWRLYYDFKPGHKVIFPEQEVRLGADRIVLIPDHCLFHCQGDEAVPSLWLTFSHPRRPVANQAIPILLEPSRTEEHLLADLAELFRRDRDGRHHHRILAHSLALLEVVLCRPEIHWLEHMPDNLTAVLRYIEQHFAEPLYVPDLARLAGLSESAFARLFRRHRGIPPRQFVVQVRVREAAHLLLHTELTIEDVAQRAGFPNAFYFGRVFKRLTGEPPARFRHQHQVAAGPR